MDGDLSLVDESDVGIASDKHVSHDKTAPIQISERMRSGPSRLSTAKWPDDVRSKALEQAPQNSPDFGCRNFAPTFSELILCFAGNRSASVRTDSDDVSESQYVREPCLRTAIGFLFGLCIPL